MPNQTKPEYEFLPAALEIEETPPHPASRAILWSLVALFTIAVVWACFGEIDIVATAQGKIIASGRDKIIQPFETGIVRAIHVHDGQSVKAGDLLVELDPTTSAADAQQVRSELTNARLDAWRWQTLTGLAENEHANVGWGEPANPNTVIEVGTVADDQRTTQTTMLRRQIDEYRARVAALDGALEQHQAELATAHTIVQKLEATLPLVTKRAADMKNLKEQGLAPEHEYLSLEQQRLEQHHDLDSQRSKAKETEAAIKNVREQKQVLRAEFIRTAMDQLAEARKKVFALEQELIKADKRNDLQRLAAPVSGVVQQLAIHTVGGVVTPAQPLMIIVPTEHQLEAEALVQNKDIGFVEDGQDAVVKIDTFPFTKYGTVNGNVLHVSNDAIEDKTMGWVYAARVSLEQSVMHVGEKVVNLSPGMTVTVEVKTGKRRIIEYFLSPLLRYGNESVRER